MDYRCHFVKSLFRSEVFPGACRACVPLRNVWGAPPVAAFSTLAVTKEAPPQWLFQDKTRSGC